MLVPFLKMHGAGNDFVVVDERAGPLGLTPERVRALADRRRGIGCDQFITLEPPPDGADVFMRIRNPDGSEAEACGNATRCIAELVGRERGASGHPQGRPVVIRTVAGSLSAVLDGPAGVAVDMGPARFGWQEIPLSREVETLHLPLPGDPAAVSVGNPHATFFVEDAERHPVEDLGPRWEHDPLFPQRANIGFAQVVSPSHMRLRVWERGAGLTLACGSGACAAAVNAVRRGLAERRVRIDMDGGTLHLEWLENGHVLMAGPVATSFRGEVEL